MAAASLKRMRPVGASVLPEQGVHFRVWANRRKKVSVVLLEGVQGSETRNEIPLTEEQEKGYFSARVSTAKEGSLYYFRLDDEDKLLPDPASLFQPRGVHGPSQVIDPFCYEWQDADWKGVRMPGQVFYEMHFGTFTRPGTFSAAVPLIADLARMGITVLELMPVAEFPGKFGWGYDGVYPFAPYHVYGSPDDLRHFVDQAHQNGLGVVLDVVYNHFGPVGNYFSEFSLDYFTDRYETEWGYALNFDGKQCGPVRDYIVANAVSWIRDFHLDGLRIDATQSIFDQSPDHVLSVLAKETRRAAGKRSIVLIAENEPQEAQMVRSAKQGGIGLDGIWNDDFHHSALVALTGRREAYYSDYLGSPQELMSLAKWGFLFQGQFYSWQQKSRGTLAYDLPAHVFVNYLQNHDQVANSARGLRLHQITSPGRFRALTAFWLLMPGTPLIFQGQEYGESAPFYYFADHQEETARQVQSGRIDFLRQFKSIDHPEMVARIADPSDPKTFAACKLNPSDPARQSDIGRPHHDAQQCV